MLQAMGQFILSLGGLLVATASLLGWGSVVRRAAGNAGGTWPVTISLGLSTVLGVGGIVILFRISCRHALDYSGRRNPALCPERRGAALARNGSNMVEGGFDMGAR
jgi:hypothetical protein